MTHRKPVGLGWESWIDRQVREATERGEFDDLPGTGEPIPDLDKPFDELGWVKRKMHQEGLSYLPPSLALRKEASAARAAAMAAGSEAEVREIVQAVNDDIREANRRGIAGPAVMLMPLDVERVVDEWRKGRRLHP